MDCKPWIEKYRPTKFKEIVLNNNNKKLLENVIKNKHFPNLLFYGPPGTGKTTTIINLINNYHTKYNNNLKGFKIHLNASDDRGIDIIRNQINQFVNTKSLFGNGLKFVILDEVDYMTKNAQQALRYLIQQYSSNIRFCLICNYISKIEKSLQNEFITLSFCNLPSDKINEFLKKIINIEKLKITNKQITDIQIMFKSDIRSMINYIQTNHDNIKINNMIINKDWNEFCVLFTTKELNKKKITKYIDNYCYKNNISIKRFISKFISYHIHNKPFCINNKWLSFFEIIIHNVNISDKYFLNFFVNQLYDLYKSL
jgi:DNA polymerase III delta prime subunit